MQQGILSLHESKMYGLRERERKDRARVREEERENERKRKRNHTSMVGGTDL